MALLLLQWPQVKGDVPSCEQAHPPPFEGL
jgi:hypothetical protein